MLTEAWLLPDGDTQDVSELAGPVSFRATPSIARIWPAVWNSPSTSPTAMPSCMSPEFRS